MITAIKIIAFVQKNATAVRAASFAMMRIMKAGEDQDNGRL